jgi:predicted phage terminase large subunit-like protein
MGFTETCEAVKTLSQRWPAARLKLIEDTANGPAIIDKLRNEVTGIVPVKALGSKLARAHAAAPALEAGNVYLPYATWVGDFIEECAQFDQGQHHDQVDAFSQAMARFEQSREPGIFQYMREELGVG